MIKEPAKGRKKNPAHNKPWQTSSGVYFIQQHSLDLAKARSHFTRIPCPEVRAVIWGRDGYVTSHKGDIYSVHLSPYQRPSSAPVPYSTWCFSDLVRLWDASLTGHPSWRSVLMMCQEEEDSNHSWDKYLLANEVCTWWNQDKLILIKAHQSRWRRNKQLPNKT